MRITALIAVLAFAVTLVLYLRAVEAEQTRDHKPTRVEITDCKTAMRHGDAIDVDFWC